MTMIRTEQYTDIDGEAMQVDFHDSYVELTVWHDSGCFPIDDVQQLRKLAAMLIEAANYLEGV